MTLILHNFTLGFYVLDIVFLNPTDRVNDYTTTQYVMCLFPPLALQEASGVSSSCCRCALCNCIIVSRMILVVAIAFNNVLVVGLECF